MKRAIYLTCICLAAICASAGTVGAEQNPVFAKANEDYAAERFQEAVEGYQSLVQSGQWSANLFYDLGNAFFRLGDFGNAILNYERALALDPHHPESEANLRLARDEARALELRKSVVEQYLDAGTPSQYSIAAAISFWLAVFAAVRLFFLRRRSLGLITLLILSAGLCATAIFGLHELETGRKGEALAIVTGKNVEAKLATADNANSVLALPPGSEIKVLSQRGDWIYAALPNDLRGWIPAKSAELVRLDTL
jgi:tetratricopeptide (TPR) repeat protein